MEIPGGAAIRGLPLVLVLGTAQAATLTGIDADLQIWKGDFDGMLERRTVRVLVPYSRTLYFNDKGAQRGQRRPGPHRRPARRGGQKRA